MPDVRTIMTLCLLTVGVTIMPLTVGAAEPDIASEQINKQEPSEQQQSPRLTNEDGQLDEDEWIDSLQSGVETSVDATARFFDRFFGDTRQFDEDYKSTGRIALSPQWSEYDNWKLRSSFRAQFRLPHAQERFSAIIGRVDFDDFVTGDDSQKRDSVLAGRSEDREWILGLGFDPHQGETSRLSVNAGIRGGLRFDWYSQVRYLWQYQISDAHQLRTRSSLFWRDSDGFGVNQRIDWEASMSEEWLSRVSFDVTRAERTSGLRWRSTNALYHLYSERRAVAAELWWEGEHKKEVPLRDYGVRFIHRRDLKRQWFFLETWVGMHWPREELIEPRKSRWMAGIEFEMWFGSGF